MTEQAAHGVEKYLWTDEDFDSMRWHDAKVRALSLEPGAPTLAGPAEDSYSRAPVGGRLLFDLDYIVRWVRPTPPEQFFTFWICPATLVFENVRHVRGGDVDLDSVDFWLDVQDLERSEPDGSGEREWTLAGHNFDPLTFSASGFRQYLRMPPVHAEHQHLTLPVRGGISFAEQAAR